jgi:hypothetical protein
LEVSLEVTTRHGKEAELLLQDDATAATVLRLQNGAEALTALEPYAMLAGSTMRN